MIDYFLRVVASDRGIVLLAVVVLVSWASGVLFTVALFWKRIRRTRYQRIDADGHCTCRRLELTRERHEQAAAECKRLALRLFGVQVSQAVDAGRQRKGA